MNLRHVVSYGLVCAVLALVGCDQGRQTPGKVTVRVANVAPSFAELRFRREQTQPAQLAFKNAQEFTWDADTYDFFIDERSLVAGVAGRSWTVAQDMRADNAYTIVLTEVAGDLQPVVLEYPAAPAADSQIVALHAGGGLPSVDLYLERPGVGIAGATPRGTMNVHEQLSPRNVPSGEYELFLTEAGNPANVLLASTTLTLSAAASSVFVVVPEAGEGTAPLSVLLLQGAPSVIYDRNTTAELRVINGATDAAPRDFAINREFAPPLFSAIPFGAPTAYAPIPPTSAQPINVTPVGNPGVLELDQTFATLPSQRSTLLFTGAAGALAYTWVADDGRRILNEAKVRFANAATQFLGVDFIVMNRDADPTGLQPDAQLGVPGAGSYSVFGPGDYDLYLRQAGTNTILSGPTQISLASGGIYGVMAVNGPDTATATLVLFDDFP